MDTFTVDTLSDDPTAGLTLREALAAADQRRRCRHHRVRRRHPGRHDHADRRPARGRLRRTIDGGTGVTIDANELSRVLTTGQLLAMSCWKTDDHRRQVRR